MRSQFSLLFVIGMVGVAMWGCDTRAKRQASAEKIQVWVEQIKGDHDREKALISIKKSATSDYTFERVYAIAAIGKLGALAHDAIPELMEGLQSKLPTVERESAIAIGRMREKGVAAVPLLIEHLHDPGVDTSWFAAEAAGAMGVHATEALPALRQAAKSDDENLREAAQDAITKISNIK